MFRSLKKLNDLPTLNVCNKDYWGSWEAGHRLFPFTSSQTQRDQCCLNFVIVLTLCLFFPVNKWNYFVPQSIKIRETKDKKTLFENVFILFSNMCMIIRGLLFFLYGNSNFSQSVWSLFTPWLDWFSLPRLNSFPFPWQLFCGLNTVFQLRILILVFSFAHWAWAMKSKAINPNVKMWLHVYFQVASLKLFLGSFPLQLLKDFLFCVDIVAGMLGYRNVGCMGKIIPSEMSWHFMTFAWATVVSPVAI